jgi:DNA-binding MarR family transcriptional regulator
VEEISVIDMENVVLLGKKADLLYQFVALYYDFSNERHDYGTGIFVSMREAHLLMRIVDHRGITITELARRIFRTKSLVSQTVKDLIKIGLVYRKTDASDARSALLYPTQQGIEFNTAHLLYDAIEVTKTFSKLTQTFTKEEIAIFFRVLEAYRQLLLE